MSDFDPWANERDTPSAPSSASQRSGAAPATQPGSWWGDEDAKAADATLRPARRAQPASGPQQAPREPSILTVCTGNICRSPYMERVLAHELAPLGVRVSSAGTGALVGQPIEPGSARLLEARGVDTSNYAARQLTEEMVAGADLVLTATREHRRLVVQVAPFALRRVFAVLDFADLCDGLTPVDLARAPGDNVVAQLVAAAGARRAQVPARQDDAADVVDPFMRGDAVFRQMQAQLDGPLATISRVPSPSV